LIGTNIAAVDSKRDSLMSDCAFRGDATEEEEGKTEEELQAEEDQRIRERFQGAPRAVILQEIACVQAERESLHGRYENPEREKLIP
jgi:hypothetical protein